MSWETGLLECCAVRDCGLNCCVQQCFCQPCVVSSALRKGGFKDGDLIGISLLLGGQGILDEIAGYFARRKVVRKYGIDEGEFRSFLISCCCAPLSNLQVVNTIMVRERLDYGCARVKSSQPPPLTARPPRNAQMRR